MALPPEETCQECGKTISRKAIAHVWDGQRIVCSACVRKLSSERNQRRAAEAASRVPATDRQIRFARELGLDFPPDITSQRMSDLIDARLQEIEDRENPPASHELLQVAGAWGLDLPPGSRTRTVESLIAARVAVVRWVYSVLRHATQAGWVLHSDAPVDPAIITAVAAEIGAEPALQEAVLEQDLGLPPNSFLNAMDDRGIEYDSGVDDNWYFFGRDGPSRRTKLYAFTKAMIERRVGPLARWQA